MRNTPKTTAEWIIDADKRGVQWWKVEDASYAIVDLAKAYLSALSHDEIVAAKLGIKPEELQPFDCARCFRERAVGIDLCCTVCGVSYELSFAVGPRSVAELEAALERTQEAQKNG